jgi:putative SOS response-associated peptidase YedK
MCNHYRAHPEAIATWREYIGWSSAMDPFSELKVDIWPRYQAMIARTDGDDRIMEPMQWGVPLQMQGKRPGTSVTKRITNVRNLASPFWRSMIENPKQRCLVPFTSFAEPMIGAGRQEHWFSVVNEPVSAFAGIWRPTDEGNAFAFLTCEPNALVAPLHPKAMPVILHPDDYLTWLSAPTKTAVSLAEPFPSQLMALEWHPGSRPIRNSFEV